jgi:hypothetical protein
MIKYLLIGLLVFLLVAISVAPAGIMNRIVSQTSMAELTHSRGSVWQGQADLLVQNNHLGQLNWDFEGTSLFQLQPTYQWSLQQAHWQLSGRAGSSLDLAHLEISGDIDAQAANQWLQPYDIRTSGQFVLQPTTISMAHNTTLPQSVEGQLDWSGGMVRYTLSGLLSEANLPPLVAYLDTNPAGDPQATVFARDDQTPLLIASVAANGFAKVGISKRFTQLLGNPWPGSDPDHKIVIEVEEKVF